MRFLYFSYLGNGFFFFLIRAEDFIPAVLGGNDTSSIYFSSGMDAAGLNRSDVSASAETRHQKCTRMYTFDDATTQMHRIFSKGTGMSEEDSIY